MCVCLCVCGGWCFHCRPVINRKLEDKVCGSGPNLKAIFEDDINMRKLGQGIQVSNCFISSLIVYANILVSLMHVGLHFEGLCHGRHLCLQV